MENTKSPFFTVVVPTYNRAHLIPKTITSILAQTYQDFELIVVDDGSTDNTKEIVEGIKDKRISYFHKVNAERGAARNFGTKKAIGKYISWFDSDDIMLKNHLQEAKKTIIENKQPEVVVLSHHYAGSDGKIIKTIIQDSNIDKTLIEGNPTTFNAVFVRKECALKNLFSEERVLSISEDYELLLRLASQYQLITSPLPTSLLIFHDERSMSTLKNAQQRIQRYELLLELVDKNKEVVHFLGKRYSYFRMKRYLTLSADLAAQGHKKKAKKYLLKSYKENKSMLFNRMFIAVLKHLIR